MSLHLSIKEINAAARQYEGKCLSREFIDTDTPLKWMCKRGHTWDATYRIFSQGAWCSQCAKKDYYLDAVKRIAEKKGGKCLSNEYVGSLTKLNFICAEGHEWSARPHDIRYNHWCPICSKRTLGIADFREIARKKGGVCLSDAYNGLKIKLQFQCDKGHRFEARPAAVKYYRKWCPQCSIHQLHTLEEMQTLAKSFKGTFLSKKYEYDKPLTWRCKAGHVWKAGYKSVLGGTWCRECMRKEQLKEIQAVAKAKGGLCLSNKYIDSKGTLQMKCAEGHLWTTNSTGIKGGHWCPACAGNKPLTLDIFQKIAKEKGGFCLSVKYRALGEKMKWKCKNGHIWLSSGATIKTKNGWCPRCASIQNGERRSYPFTVIQKMVLKRNGKIISGKKEYRNGASLIRLQCRNGHQWQIKAQSVTNGKWCAACAGVKKHSIDEMQKAARDRGGKCLSASYISGAKLKWKCERGHIWQASANNIRSGSWCPECAGTRKHTIDEMHKLAAARNGKCLSGVYINNKTALKWQCDQGHKWMKSPEVILKGRWCPVC